MNWLDYLWFVLVLIALLAVMFALAKLIQQVKWHDRLAGLFGQSNTGTPRTQRLKIIEYRYLDTRRKICLVACDDQEFLAMIGPNNDTLLPLTTKKPKAKSS